MKTSQMVKSQFQHAIKKICHFRMLEQRQAHLYDIKLFSVV